MTLIDKINQLSAEIAKATRNGSANYIICSSKIVEAIENLDIRKQRRKKLDAIKLKNKLEEMNVITLCGSTKYKNEFLMVNKWLTLQGNIVISVSMFGHVDKEPLLQSEKIILDAIHKGKIDLANEIFVVNVNGYIGGSTKSEIEYADSKGKKIRFLTDEKNEFEKWKHDFYDRKVLEDWNNSDFKIYQDTIPPPPSPPPSRFLKEGQVPGWNEPSKP